MVRDALPRWQRTGNRYWTFNVSVGPVRGRHQCPGGARDAGARGRAGQGHQQYLIAAPAPRPAHNERHSSLDETWTTNDA